MSLHSLLLILHAKEWPDDLEERVAAIVASRGRDHWVSLCADAPLPCAPASTYGTASKLESAKKVEKARA